MTSSTGKRSPSAERRYSPTSDRSPTQITSRGCAVCAATLVEAITQAQHSRDEHTTEEQCLRLARRVGAARPCSKHGCCGSMWQNRLGSSSAVPRNQPRRTQKLGVELL